MANHLPSYSAPVHLHVPKYIRLAFWQNYLGENPLEILFILSHGLHFTNIHSYFCLLIFSFWSHRFALANWDIARQATKPTKPSVKFSTCHFLQLCRASGTVTSKRSVKCSQNAMLILQWPIVVCLIWAFTWFRTSHDFGIQDDYQGQTLSPHAWTSRQTES